MKIEAKLLKDFVVKATADCTINELVIRTVPEGIKSMMRTPDNTTAIMARLTKNRINTFNPEFGVIAINNTTMFKNILGTFNGIISLDKQENVLRINGEGKYADVLLADESFIDVELKKELTNITFDNNFKLPAKIFNNAVTNSTLLKTEKITLEVKDKKFSIMSGEKNSNRITEEENVDFPNTKTVLSAVTFPVFRLLEGEVEVFMKDENYALQLINKTEDLTVKTIIAPIQEDEE